MWMANVELTAETKSLLLMADGRKAYYYAKTGRYPHENENLMREQIGMRGLFRGRVGYNPQLGKRVAILEEKIRAVHVFWEMGGGRICIRAPEHWTISLRSGDARRESITALLGDPKTQSKLHRGGWTYIREVTEEDWNFLKSLASD